MQDKILKILFITTNIVYAFGVLAQIPGLLPGTNLYLLDIMVFIFGCAGLLSIKNLKKQILNDEISCSAILLIFILFLSWLLTPLKINYEQKIVSLLYLFRFIAYFLIYINIKYLSDTNKINTQFIVKILLGISISLIFLGWIQYLLYPDLRNLYYLGWDPHYRRIFATILDPNFLGLIFTVLILFTYHSMNKHKSRYLLLFLLFITLIFTYSRASYLSLTAGAFYYFYRTCKIKYTIIFLLIIILSILLLPTKKDQESLNLTRIFTIEGRLTSWQEGLTLFSKYPVLGVGYNNLRFAKKEYNLLPGNWEDIHSGAGIENSFIFMLVTAGLLGFISFMNFIIRIFPRKNILASSIIIAIIIHSIFNNSFFFPWVMYLMWIILAMEKQIRDYRSL